MLVPRDLSVLEPLQRAYAEGLAPQNARIEAMFATAIADARAEALAAPHDAALWRKLAKLLARSGQPDASVAALIEGTERAEPEPSLWWRTVGRLFTAGRGDEALEFAHRADALFPDDLRFWIVQYVGFPAVLTSARALERWTHQLTAGLTALLAGDSRLDEASPAALLAAVADLNIFYADYLPRNTRDWHEQWSGFVRAVVARALPAVPPPDSAPRDQRIRVAFVSEVLREHIVGFLFQSWARDLDPSRFEVLCYACHDVTDHESAKWEGFATRFVRSNYSAELAEAIRTDAPDVIVYLAVGMSPAIAELAAQRLAPVQCAAWGHPVTTGLPTIDYFLSADAVEPVGAEEYYSERLVRLPGMAVCFELPALLQPLHVLRRADFGLGDDDMVFACTQSGSKFLPAFDDVMIAIARELPESKFVFTLGGQLWGSALLRRISDAFARAGLDWSRHGVELPELNPTEFRNLLSVSDALLDSHGWTAGYTALDAIACGLPIITTMGGPFRTRQAGAMLTLMGETRTIAADVAGCVAVATRLARDSAFRASVRARLLDPEARRVLCDNPRCIPALERFLTDAVDAVRPAGG